MDFRIDEFDVFAKADIMETIRNVEINEQAYEIQRQKIFVLQKAIYGGTL